jgi:cystathionine beta-lyase/cystathionine gamma-synthase
MTSAPNPATLHADTRAVHVRAPELDGSQPVSVPIYQTTTFAFSDPDLMADGMTRPDGAYNYSRLGNPTVRALETAIADLEGGVGALATSAGLGAINAVLFALAGTGDHVIASHSLYGGTHATLRDLADRFGVAVTHVAGDDASEVRAALRPETRMLYLETIANPMTQVADLPTLAAVSREAGLITVVDNTFATPLLCRPIEYGVDVVVHSTTKYIAGHSDVTGGVAVFADDDLRRRVWKHAIEMGVSADPFASWLTIRGLATLPLRLRKQCDNAGILAERLSQHAAVEAVHWPGLASHPHHALANKILGCYGGLLAFDVKGGRDAGQAFVGRLRLAKLAASLGGTATLVLHAASTSHRQLDAAALAAAGIGAGTIRVAVGIEHAEDLWSDFNQALG